jgi:glycerol-3-phosphate acyltransferase PlsX
MGKLYAQSVYGVKTPKTYLLSNGAEEGKGAPEVKEAYKLLKESIFEGFSGNIEARYALNGEADVVVADGFTGNIFLKSSEGIAKIMSGMIKKAFKKNLWTKLGYLHVRKGMKEMSETMDYKSAGGAMLLGINGNVVKAHGSSDTKSFYHALRVARKLSEYDVVNKIRNGIENA